MAGPRREPPASAPEEGAAALDATALDAGALDATALDATVPIAAVRSAVGSAPSGGEPSAPGLVDPVGADLDDRGFQERYQLGVLLGAGGMGEVHLCLDRRVGRRVALKRRRRGEGSSGEARARFVREARVQGQLEHPAVVPVYDLGHTPEGAEFFTMKRVRGRTLADVLGDLRRGEPEALRRYSRRRLLATFSSACVAVHYAHTRGVLHRDLKPANLMLGDFGEIYVLDWGLAKIAGEVDAAQDEPLSGAGGGDEVVTLAGSLLGTPGYLAPERLEGHGDVRSDVYALGAVLFELLTLEPLHPRRALQEMLSETREGIEARPSVRCPGLEVAPELEALCAHATARRPEERTPSALALHEAIERYLDGDRDLALRRSLADAHARVAVEAAERALGPAPTALAERRRALGEVSRALALDPASAVARGALMRLLTEPPRELPPEAEAALRDAGDAAMRTSARTGFMAFATALLALPLIVWMGVRSWPLAIASVSLHVATMVVQYVASLRPRPGRWLPLLSLGLSTLTIGSASLLFGPYVGVPAFVAINTIGYAAHRGFLAWPLVVAVGSLAIVGPALLERLEVLPPAYRFDGGAITVLPRVLELPPRAAEAALLVMSLGVVVIAALYAVRLRRALAQAERLLHLQAWQLRQLAPEGQAPGGEVAPPTP